MFKSATSVQADPLKDSVIESEVVPEVSPPKASTEVLLIPAPAKSRLPVFKEGVFVHDDSFQDSEFVLFGFPPNANAEATTPVPDNSVLAVFKSANSVQLEPL